MTSEPTIRPGARRTACAAGLRGLLPRGAGGFTLVEMMTSVALALIMMAVTITAFSRGAALFRLAHAKTEVVHSAQVALEFLAQDIQSAVIDANGRAFVGVLDTSLGSVDNDNDAAFDEDGAALGEDNDCIDFVNSSGHERHGLEMVSMSLYAMDESGQPVPGEHVLYYVTRDGLPGGQLTEGGHEVGRLIRWREEYQDPVDPWLDTPGGGVAVGLNNQKAQTLAFGVIAFRLRYYDGTQWLDSWDSVSVASPQYNLLPQTVEVTLRVVDMDGYLDSTDNTPFDVTRLISVGAAAP